MSYSPKLSAPITLRDWYKDTGRKVKDVADALNIEPNYLSGINGGRQKPGEALKETFRKLFPGYDVIEMRAGEQVESVVEEPIEQEEPRIFQALGIIEHPSMKGKTIVYLLERDGDTIAYGSKEAMHQDIICLAIAELGIKTREVELR